MPVDNVPYIGPLPSSSENSFVATGFRKWGMTTGTVAAMILTDLIFGKANAWEEIYDDSNPSNRQKILFRRLPKLQKASLGTGYFLLARRHRILYPERVPL
jgi:glycine/D-amino acid oxidase-like deaminating enzyme